MYLTIVKKQYWKFNNLDKAIEKADNQLEPAWVIDGCSADVGSRSITLKEGANPVHSNLYALIWEKDNK